MHSDWLEGMLQELYEVNKGDINKQVSFLERGLLRIAAVSNYINQTIHKEIRIRL